MKFEHSDSFACPTEYYQNPLLRHLPQEHRTGGSFDVKMFTIEQCDFEATDPPFDVFTVTAVIESEMKNCRVDFGDGWVEHDIVREGQFGPQPAAQECSFELPGPHHMLNVSLPISNAQELLLSAGFDTDPFCALYGHMSDHPRGLLLMKTMWNAMKNGGPANNLAVDAALIQLMLTMIEGAGLAEHLVPPPQLANPQLARVIDYIETYYHASLLTSELAAIAAMSTVHFGRCFKTATGASPHAYVMGRRVEHAKYMLRDATLNITQIAYACGFSSAAHFSTVFKAQVGITPSAYRKAIT
ncbi:helix-turn-helix domain-containing protein [Jannaschia sp. CCS1]|uniref:helix-turn-helix domain-containing protein n=1 Tax=Jannaschia sp. (strain CCS1) TaxID=290400 RepID=UPI000053CA6F|nr:AraC family transcriptional regulator [Jannaschia sp. CCS1]ABD56399.1 transcriptional regulator, AraC family [Jannaschia sp. CCS1]